MPTSVDGPCSSLFRPVPLRGTGGLDSLAAAGASAEMVAAAGHAPTGRCVCWGIPFRLGRPIVLAGTGAITRRVGPLKARWLVFLHTSDNRPMVANAHGLFSPTRGRGQLGEHAGDYVVVYADGSESRTAIRRRFHIGPVQRGWGENCAQAVAHHKPHPMRPPHEQAGGDWGRKQTRVAAADDGWWVDWLWAWENPTPAKAIVAVRFEPGAGLVVISGLSAGDVESMPLRWNVRRKAVVTLPAGAKFQRDLDEHGLLQQVRLDLGQVISAMPRAVYPNDAWDFGNGDRRRSGRKRAAAEPVPVSESYNNRLPDLSDREVLVEYTSHDEARFHLSGGKTVAVAAVEARGRAGGVRAVAPATQRVTVRVVTKAGRVPVAVKLHVHGQAGEYLPPVDRHRIPNAAWFEDYSVDFSHAGRHHCTYIDGQADLNLPIGQVFLEVSKGFEIRPVRKALRVTPATRELVVEVEKVLPWRDRGWVSADTHVHFLTPTSALLEGAGEGVNVVNLLASQWGELMTNAGDFDGRTTHGSRRSGGDGEYLVRVGTENRQHILGHISLLGYSGRVIAPMTTGGPDESALGDPVEVLLTEWARTCHARGGLVVLPHFPNPRMEGAAAIVSGDIDAVEMTCWGNLYGGIDPYTLSDWYRFLNCGYMTAAVGGTDKMAASTAVGTVRTYARIPPGRAFSYEAWKQAVRGGQTFVTYGPLMEFAVQGKPSGSRLRLPHRGGTLDVTWELASVTVPMTSVELIVNGEVRQSQPVGPWAGRGGWSVKLDRTSWLALLVRGHYRDKPEIIAAHSSPVLAEVKGTELHAAADALTILEQIEGTLAYLDTVGTRADTAAMKRMRLVLTAAHRQVHNRMHRLGNYHQHGPTTDHREHHR